MNHVSGRLECPHCHESLQAFSVPEESGWDGEFQLACFNDECPYYERGWQWMNEKYGVKASYRFRVDPNTGTASPLAVWAPDALKDRILDAEISASDDADPEPRNESEGAAE